MTIWPFVFVRKGMAHAYRDVDANHEGIHGEQQLELLTVGAIIALVLAVVGCDLWSFVALPIFFYWYGLEYLIRWAVYRNRDKAYENICFEREAYGNQHDMDYIDRRDPFAWFKYLWTSN